MEEYEHYDLTENDPYTIDGLSGCLKNLLGIMDTRELNEAEAEISKISMADLVVNPVTPTWDLLHLKEIHLKLFSDIYPFAGEIRKAEISKGNKLFLPYKLIEIKSSEIFQKLQTENYLQNLSVGEFADRAGYFLGQINLVHPFREGNGRVQRIFINQLADLNGYFIEWNAISNLAMIEACREARITDLSAYKLRKILKLHTVDNER